MRNDLTSSTSIAPVVKKIGRPFKKRLHEGNNNIFFSEKKGVEQVSDPEICMSDMNDLAVNSLQQVDDAGEDMFGWKTTPFHNVLDNFNFHFDTFIFQPVLELAPLPPSDFLLSLLLNERGVPLFVANAKEIAASVGLYLDGLLWALVHHKDCGSDQEESCMDHWLVVAHSEAFSMDFCGRSLASIMCSNAKDRDRVARLFNQVLFRGFPKCSVATVLMNAVVVRGNGEKAEIRNSFVFFDQVSLLFLYLHTLKLCRTATAGYNFLFLAVNLFVL